ncbi:MAG: hypothetical protein WAQ99_02245 [Pyrinomonadaceae bacterium]
MATPESHAYYSGLSRARQYKAEFLRMMFGASAATAAAARHNQKLSVFDVLSSRRNNIIGLGFGLKTTKDGTSVSDEEAVRVYVPEKLPATQLSASSLIPKSVNGLPTEVVPVGELVAAVRPQPCGVSIGHHAITAGTLGCLVRRRSDDGALYILSNNHVLADCDQAALGDLILEPGPEDGGTIEDPIAVLSDFEPIMDGKPAIFDAAIARLLDPQFVTRDIRGIGFVQPPPLQVLVNHLVSKSGRTTQVTQGRIVGSAEDVSVNYRGCGLVNFEGQLAINGLRGPFALLGDSGSLVVDVDSRNPVGLFFAVGLRGEETALANPIQPILDRFDCEII